MVTVAERTNTMKLTKTMMFSLLLAGVATAQDVQYNFDQQVDFSRFKTYKWVQIPGGQKLDDLLARQIRDAFDAGLANKGLTKTDAGSADLYIGWQAAVNQEKQLTAYGSGWGYGPGWRGGLGRGPGIGTATTSTILIGTLALDMYDSQNKHLVWRSTATKTIDTHASPEKRSKNITKAVDKMLKNYPPKKKG
jgi:Domain of unknown function (DUF4136)